MGSHLSGSGVALGSQFLGSFPKTNQEESYWIKHSERPKPEVCVGSPVPFFFFLFFLISPWL